MKTVSRRRRHAPPWAWWVCGVICAIALPSIMLSAAIVVALWKLLKAGR